MWHLLSLIMADNVLDIKEVSVETVLGLIRVLVSASWCRLTKLDQYFESIMHITLWLPTDAQGLVQNFTTDSSDEQRPTVSKCPEVRSTLMSLTNGTDFYICGMLVIKDPFLLTTPARNTCAADAALTQVFDHHLLVHHQYSHSITILTISFDMNLRCKRICPMYWR